MASMVRARGTQLSSRHPTSVTTIINDGSTTSGIERIPSFNDNPWNTYRLFVELGPSESLVLCNNQTEVRVMRIVGNTSDVAEMTNEAPFPLIAIRHPNFVVLHDAYHFRKERYACVEYAGCSLQDMLKNSVYPSEGEISCIIGQVGTVQYAFISSIWTLTHQVLAAIRFVWEIGIRHPRISTGNIFINPKGKVKVGKFLRTHN